MQPWIRALLMIIGACHAAIIYGQGLLNLPSLPLNGAGRVEAIAVQADGKIIIGGAFGYVDAAGDARVNIARFNTNGSLDTTFNLKATSTVNALAIVGNTLYLGGDFTGLSVDGSASTLRNRLAAVDLATLSITSWNPDVDGEVFALAASGSTLYAGGRFTFVSGVQRIGGAAFNVAAAGALTSWDPEPRDADAPGPAFQGVIYALAPFAGTVYVGGTFTQIGGLATPQARDNLAAVDPASGAATSWDPTVSNGGGTAIVRALVATASSVYVGGQFSTLNGVNAPAVQRLAIGALSTATGTATAFNPGMTSGFGTVRALLLDGSTLYAGGEFTAISGATRNRAAGIDTTTPAISSITRVATTATVTVASTAGLANGGSVTIAGASPSAYNGVKTISIVDGTHFSFAIAGTPTSPATGTISYANNSAATSFDPHLDNDVHSFALTVPSSTALLIGGRFVKANNAANPAFGGFNKASGATAIAGYVYDTAAVSALVRQSDGKTIVAGDFFMNVANVLYQGLARLNADDTLDTGWNPVVDGQVVTAALGPIVAPAVSPTTVLIGGTFAKVGATARPRLAAVDLTTGAATGFDANVNAPVNKVLVDGTTAYIGGQFTSVGASGRNYIAAVDASSGVVQPWYPAGGSDDFVETLAVDGASVYLGGSFFTVGGQSRLNVAKVAKASSIVDAWNPGADEKVFGLTVVGNVVYVSGNFGVLGGQARNFTGAVNATTGAVTPWNPDPDFIVLKVVPSPTAVNTLYLAGAFIDVAGTQVGNAAAVDATTGAVKAWYPLLNDAVYDLLPDASRVMVGGVFVSSGTTTRLSLAAFSNIGVPDPPTGVTATLSGNSAVVSFSAPGNNGGSAITGYTVTSLPAGAIDTQAGSTATTHTITGLATGTSYAFTVTATNAAGTSGPSAPSNTVRLSGDLAFTPVTPCRLIDTRNAVGALGPRSARSFAASDAVRIGQAGGNGAGCAIPVGPSALALTVTAVVPTQVGNLAAYAAGSAVPLASALNFLAGQIIANTTIVPIAPGAGDSFGLFNNSDGSTHVVADVVGYFWEYQAADCVKTTQSQSLFGGGTATVVSSCAAGFVAVGSGCSADSAASITWLDRRNPSNGLGGSCSALNTSPSSVTVTTDTLCCRKPGR